MPISADMREFLFNILMVVLLSTLAACNDGLFIGGTITLEKDGPGEFSIQSYSVSDSSINVEWSASKNASFYEVLYRAQGDTVYSVESPGSNSNFTITSLQNGT